MTGNELQKIMDRLHLNGNGMAEVTGFTRQRIYQLVALGDEHMPADTRAKIATGLLRHNHEAAAALLTANGEAA